MTCACVSFFPLDGTLSRAPSWRQRRRAKEGTACAFCSGDERIFFENASEEGVVRKSESSRGVPLGALFSFFLIFHVFHSFLHFLNFFLFSCMPLLAFVLGFNKRCFPRIRCSMEMWCLDDIGRDSWDWVGPPAWGRACFNSPEWGGGSSPVKAEPSQIALLLLFQRRLRCEMCMTTNDQRCNESLRLIYMEPLMMKNSSSSRKPPQTAKNGALVEIMSRFQRANRAERNRNQKHRLCTLSIQNEWRPNASGFEFTAP